MASNDKFLRYCTKECPVKILSQLALLICCVLSFCFTAAVPQDYLRMFLEGAVKDVQNGGKQKCFLYESSVQVKHSATDLISENHLQFLCNFAFLFGHFGFGVICCCW